MAHVTSAGKPPDDGKEQRRRIIEDALLAFRPEVVEQLRELIGREVPTPHEALENLAVATGIHRLLKHRLLVDAIRRSRTDAREALDGPVRRVLDSMLDPDLDPDTRRSRVDDAKRQLDAAAAADGELWRDAERRRRQVSRTDDLLGFSTHERTFQACDSDELVAKARPDGQLVQSRLIVAEFWSDDPPTAFAGFIDPANWPSYSAFWEAMTELRPRTPRANGYDCDFEEAVRILGETLTVPLQVAFRVRPDRSRVWTRYNIAREYYTPAVPVDVDTGTVSAEAVMGGPARTLVRATKYLHWSDPGRPDFTNLACACGWSEFMIQMADASRERPRPSRARMPATTAETSDDDAVRRFVEQVTTEWRDGIDDCAPHLENLIGRFTGPSWDARWINDLLAMSQVTAVRYGRVARHVRRLAGSLMSAETGRGERA